MVLLWCMCLQFQNAVQCFVFANNANINTSQLNYIRCVRLELNITRTFLFGYKNVI